MPGRGEGEGLGEASEREQRRQKRDEVAIGSFVHDVVDK
jgi:hypothetical protein